MGIKVVGLEVGVVGGGGGRRVGVGGVQLPPSPQLANNHQPAMSKFNKIPNLREK